MSTLRNILGKGSVQAVLAIALVGTSCYLAVTKAIDGPTFLAVAVIAVTYYFGKSGSGNGSP